MTERQRAAVDSVTAALDERTFCAFCHGITGSGKTQVYIESPWALEHVGRSCSSRIALTPQTVHVGALAI